MGRFSVLQRQRHQPATEGSGQRADNERESPDCARTAALGTVISAVVDEVGVSPATWW
ncbi:hypothetical protein GCM10022419_089140 [Nonomuraea rosea]|uniref:Uncharacterized protein n=1 Tax=Nonomuraea rosea TaxID=638574 RepID=A0ABP6YXX2_9ACTN